MRVVVGAAVVRRGRLLAARRGHPPELAGRWELPGGAVEAGESEAAALARECVEELALPVVVTWRVGPDVPVGTDRVLRVYRCTTDGDPVAHEHAALRWISAGELDELDWLDADRALLPALRAELA